MTRLSTATRASAFAAIVALLFGCADLLTSRPRSFVRIANIVPELNAVLRPGETVTIVVDAEYEVSAGQATLGLVIQHDSSRKRLNEDLQIAVNQGTGTVKLSSTVLVPDASTLNVYVPLFEGGSRTTIVDSRVYRIRPAK